MNKPFIIQTVAVLFALVAVYVSYQLYVKHMTGSAAGLIEAGCGGDGGGGSADCEEVLKSPHGYWPPKKEGEPADTKHVPVALLGMFYYACLSLWLIGVGRPSYEQRWIHVFPLFMNGLGLAASAWFAYLMFGGVLGNWCPWCAITHVINLLIFLCLIVLWPTKATAPAAVTPPIAVWEGEGGAVQPTAPAPVAAAAVTPVVPNPSGRQVVITLLGMVLVWIAVSLLNVAVEKAGKAQNLDKCLATLDEYKHDTKRLVTLYDTSEKREIELRPDDAIRGGKEGERGLVCVVFSDFECPHCDKQAFFLEEKVQPLFDGNLKIVFKHFPLNTDCNGLIKTTMHKNACKAAGMAEAARMQGGSEAFWRAHDYLFHHRHELGKLDADSFAAELGLDAERLRTDGSSPDVAKRIWEDVNLAAKAGVRATPSIYLSGKEVSGLARMSVEFWDEMARRYWLLRGTPRPEHTMLKKAPADANAGGAGQAGP